MARHDGRSARGAATAAISKPPIDVRAAIVAVANGSASAQQQIRFYRFVVFELCGAMQLAMSLPAEESVQNWRAGLRHVGLYLEMARQLPADDPPPPEPPARTTSEQVRRRQRRTIQG
jgi:hypothetical protein